MKNNSFRAVAAATVLSLAASSAGCAYVFHPERRGNTGGEIAGAPLLGDILWLFVGIVPGVVFLIVDFSSGAIYRGDHGRHYGAADHMPTHYQPMNATVHVAQ